MAHLSTGCAPQNGENLGSRLKSNGGGNHASIVAKGSGDLSPMEVGSLVMGFADTFNVRVVQACDELMATPDATPEVKAWASQIKVGQTLASLTAATGPNPVVNLLDMTVIVTLKRGAIEEYAIPNVLKERGGKILDVYKQSERDIWAIVGRTLSQSQIDELHATIEQWRKDNPGQRYVGFVRFEDFGAYRQQTIGPGGSAVPGSLFSLFMIDPLAGLDPMAKEIYAVRQLTERLAFLAPRLPVIMMWHARESARDVLAAPEIQAFVHNTETFAAATSRFADATAAYPKDLSVEREAAVAQLSVVITKEREEAIKQIASSVDAQRLALTADIEAQDKKVHAILADVRTTVEGAKGSVADMNDSTAKTIAVAKGSTNDVLDRLFVWLVVLAVVLIVGVTGAVVASRYARRRWPDPAPSDS